MIDLVREKIKAFRRIEYILSKPEHAMIIPDQGCKDAIIRGDAEFVASWYRQRLMNDLDSLSLKDLRDRAAILRVNPIWGLSKAQLIIRIMEKQRDSESVKERS